MKFPERKTKYKEQGPPCNQIKKKNKTQLSLRFVIGL
jgi:hypothetical protein